MCGIVLIAFYIYVAVVAGLFFVCFVFFFCFFVFFLVFAFILKSPVNHQKSKVVAHDYNEPVFADPRRCADD